MKLLILTLLLPLPCTAAQAQTKTPIVEKNIKDCFKKSGKGPSAFDYCVAEEFRRVKEEKEYRAARIATGKDPDAGCGKKNAYKECFDEIMSDMRRTSDSLYDGSGTSSDYIYIPRTPNYRYRSCYPRYYPRYIPRYPFTYPSRSYYHRTYRRW